MSEVVIRADRLVRLALAALAGALCEASGVALTATAVWLICRAAQQPPLAVLAVAIVLVRALAIGRGGLRYLERIVGHDTALRAMAWLRGKVFDALTPLSPSRLVAVRRADLVTNVVSDMDAGQELLLRVALPALSAFIVGVAGVLWELAVLPAAGLALAGGILLAGLGLPSAAVLVLNRHGEDLRAATAELATSTVDIVDGAEDLLLNGATARFTERHRSAARAIARLERRRALSQSWLEGCSMLVQLGTCAVAGWLGIGAQRAGGLDSTTVAVLVLVTLTVLETARPLRAAGEQLGTRLAAVRRLRSVLRPIPSDEPAHPAPAPQRPVSVELTEVTVRYPGADQPALASVSLSLSRGSRVAIVGPSGSGKSTLLSVVARLEHPDSGRITLAGRGIDELAGTDLRPGLVGTLTQDARLFTGSVRANLLLAKPTATAAELWSALARTGADHWVRSRPDDLDTPIGHDGERLSGGERQRLALAMVLLSDPDVLLLDEPTESLDSATASTVLADTVGATVGRTVLMVSHQLRGLEPMDQIVVLCDGRITQRGRHADLLVRPGYYREQYLAELAAPAPS